jgi:hypothetical protein
MMRSLFSLAAVVFLIAIFSGCSKKGDNGVEPTPTPPPRVVVETHQDPTFDNALTSDVWDSIDAVTIPMGTDTAYNADRVANPPTNLDMKALIADDSILYIWVQWNDTDKDDRFGQLRAGWVNNRIEWVVNYPYDTLDVTYNEDRFYALFDKGGTNGADCAAMCHAAGDTSAVGRRFYGDAGDNADVWDWKANRTGLAKLADDMHMTTEKVDFDPIVNQTSDSLYFRNYTIEQQPDPAVESYIIAPKYMHPDSTLFTGPALLESEMPGYLFVDFKPDLNWVTFPPNLPPAGLYLPGYYIYDRVGHDGSRWDVRAQSEYSAGKWTVVLRRALTTTDAADVSFNFGTPDSIAVSIAVTDNSGMKHLGHAPFYLVFQ